MLYVLDYEGVTYYIDRVNKQLISVSNHTITIGYDQLPLRIIAEIHCIVNGNIVPNRDSDEYQQMYEKWVKYAFNREGD